MSGSYDTGYYSYLWADLHAAQTFDRFKTFPSWEQTGHPDLQKSLKTFLGGPLDPTAFIKKIGYEHLVSQGKALTSSQSQPAELQKSSKKSRFSL